MALRAAYDDLVKNREIRPCGCRTRDCVMHTFSDRARHEMDRRRPDLLAAAQAIDPSLRAYFYDL
ncbi:MAG: hypothetical protein U0821_19085 [Chloroflexota bacterium]